MVAGGPFTLHNEFDFAPLRMHSNGFMLMRLEQFLKKVVEVRPNIVIFIGPFLDQNTEAVKSGELCINNGATYLDYNTAFEILLEMINEALKGLLVDE